MIFAEPLELKQREVDYWQSFLDYIKENELEELPLWYNDW